MNLFSSQVHQLVDKLEIVSGPSDTDGRLIVVVTGVNIRSSLDGKQGMREAASSRSSEQAHVDFVRHFVYGLTYEMQVQYYFLNF